MVDTGKMVMALASSQAASALELLGKPELIGPRGVPLIAIPTTAGTGSESSPVSALHLSPGGAVVGTRSPKLVPTLAICDPDLLRTLPARLMAATGIDTLAHCLEGFLAEPANPVVDALALDGLKRAYSSLEEALRPAGEDARASMMAAAYCGGAAIHKGLGAVHAIAISCGDQGLHHGALVAAALPSTFAVVAGHLPEKADRIASSLGLASASDIPQALSRPHPCTGSAIEPHAGGIPRAAGRFAARSRCRESLQPIKPLCSKPQRIRDFVAASARTLGSNRSLSVGSSSRSSRSRRPKS